MSAVPTTLSVHDQCRAFYKGYTPYRHQRAFGSKWLIRWGATLDGYGWCVMQNGGSEILAFGEERSEVEANSAAIIAAKKLEEK